MISILGVAIGRNVSVFAANDDLSLLSKMIFGLADSTFIDKNGSGVYSKKVSLEEIEELYRYATYAVINNYKVNVEKENEEYYFVGTADCKVAEALGLQRCDKYYYEGKFPRQDVEIIEEKEKIEL